ncbi:MAG: hemolysin family protein [bacterium]
MDPDWSLVYAELGIVVVATIASAILSAAETALTTLSAAKTQQLIEEEKATWLKLWLNSPSKVITAILVGKSLANVVAAALAVDVTRRLLSEDQFHSGGLLLAIGLTTFVLLTFAEIVPKAFAKRSYQSVASVLIRVLLVPYYLFYPITWLYSQLTQGIVRSIGGGHMSPGPLTFDEIEYMLEMNGDHEESDHTRLLRSVVEFPDTVVREVMVPRTDIIAIAVDMPVKEIITTLVTCGHSRLPLYESSIDNIVAMLYAKDLMRYHAEHGTFDGFNPMDAAREPYFVPESKRIADLLAEFQKQRMHIAIVVDEFGGTSGIITLEDIVEEIFGDIQDEYDVEPSQITELGDDRLLADARIPIYEIEEYYGVELPESPDYESLGGFLLAQAGNVPQAGDVFEVVGLRFSVVEADAKRIITIAVEPLDAQAAAEAVPA